MGIRFSRYQSTSNQAERVTGSQQRSQENAHLGENHSNVDNIVNLPRTRRRRSPSLDANIENALPARRSRRLMEMRERAQEELESSSNLVDNDSQRRMDTSDVSSTLPSAFSEQGLYLRTTMIIFSPSNDSHNISTHINPHDNISVISSHQNEPTGNNSSTPDIERHENNFIVGMRTSRHTPDGQAVSNPNWQFLVINRQRSPVGRTGNFGHNRDLNQNDTTENSNSVSEASFQTSEARRSPVNEQSNRVDPVSLAFDLLRLFAGVNDNEHSTYEELIAFQELFGVVSRGVSQDLIHSHLKTTAYSPIKYVDIRCSICLSDYIIDEIIRDLPCGHYFHVECIDTWLTGHLNSCPLCRREAIITSM